MERESCYQAFHIYFRNFFLALKKFIRKFNKMKIFETIKVYLTICLLYSDRSKFFDLKRFVISIVFAVIVTSLFIFLMYEVHTIMEYVRSMYMTTTALGISISYIATLFKRTRIFTMIRNLEKVIEKSM